MDFHPANPIERNNFAVLIDGDNAQPALFEKILLEIARYGRPTIRRIYGDWTASNMSSWRAILQDHAISPVQQFRNTTGKNATDSALIIDAMDILNGNLVKGFCIVSSDSDFTRLATRIREDGIMVIGVGKRTTPKAFVQACDIFIHTENLAEPSDLLPIDTQPPTKSTTPPTAKPTITAKTSTNAMSSSTKTTATTKKQPVKETKQIPSKPTATPTPKKKQSPPPIKMLQKAFDMSVQEDGTANLGLMGSSLRQIDPAFDPRTWGYTQLNQLLKAASTHFELENPKGSRPGGTYIKKKETAEKKPAK